MRTHNLDLSFMFDFKHSFMQQGRTSQGDTIHQELQKRLYDLDDILSHYESTCINSFVSFSTIRPLHIC